MLFSWPINYYCLLKCFGGGHSSLAARFIISFLGLLPQVHFCHREEEKKLFMMVWVGTLAIETCESAPDVTLRSVVQTHTHTRTHARTHAHTHTHTHTLVELLHCNSFLNRLILSISVIHDLSFSKFQALLFNFVDLPWHLLTKTKCFGRINVGLWGPGWENFNF